MNICINNSTSKGSCNSSTCNLLSSRKVLIWLEIVTGEGSPSEVFLFTNSWHDLISLLFILNYSWIYKIQKPKETRKVMLKNFSSLTCKVMLKNFSSLLSHETNSLFRRSLYHFPTSKLSLPSLRVVLSFLFFKGSLSGLRQFLATESPLKMMKNVFCFIPKALFILKIFKFSSWLFGHVSKQLD